MSLLAVHLQLDAQTCRNSQDIVVQGQYCIDTYPEVYGPAAVAKYRRDIGVINNQRQQAPAGDGSKHSIPSTQCLKISPADSNGIGTSYIIRNTCSIKVSSSHCFDRSSGLGGVCSNKEPPGNGGSMGEWWGGHQGNGDLMPGATTKTVYVENGSYLHVRGCEIPEGSWWVMFQPIANGGRFVCNVMQ